MCQRAARSRDCTLQELPARHVRLWCSADEETVMYVPRGTGRRACSPAAFVKVNTVSSALYLGMQTTGGKCRSASLNTLEFAPVGCVSADPKTWPGRGGTRRTLRSRRRSPSLRMSAENGGDPGQRGAAICRIRRRGETDWGSVFGHDRHYVLVKLVLLLLVQREEYERICERV